MLTYFELWQEWNGCKNTNKTEVDETAFALLLAIAEDVDDDDDMYNAIVDGKGRLSFLEDDARVLAFMSLITEKGYDKTTRAKQVKAIVKDLDKKGYYAQEWEEGSQAIALPGFEKDAVQAIKDIEARVAEDSWGF